jgi:hypothetical protein
MDASLHATIDAFGNNVVLHSDEIRAATLRAIVDCWGEDRDRAITILDQLAQAADGSCEQWDSAVVDAETDFQMPYPHVELDETRALQLADEIRAAAGRTFAARSRAGQSIPFPHQQDQGRAA